MTIQIIITINYSVLFSYIWPLSATKILEHAIEVYIMIDFGILFLHFSPAERSTPSAISESPHS